MDTYTGGREGEKKGKRERRRERRMSRRELVTADGGGSVAGTAILGGGRAGALVWTSHF